MRGVFEDAGTSSPVPDEVAGIRLTGLVKAHLAGERGIPRRTRRRAWKGRKISHD